MAKKQTSTSRASRASVRVLFTCVGRRVELVEAFRRAGRGMRLGLEIHGSDASKLSPAYHRVDKAHLVGAMSGGHYVDDLLRLVRRAKIDLLIPTIDPELPLLAEAMDRFAAIGCRALVSSPAVIRTCRDKIETHHLLDEAGIDTPRTWLWEEAIELRHPHFPMFLKPRSGSAGVGSYVIQSTEELETLGRRVHGAIVQEFVEGVEHTLDVYAGLDGVPRCVVPRKRLEVRTGEVSKALIVKDRSVMAVGKRVVEVLGKCRGVVTVQCIVTPEGRIRVIEVNPRFGGGVPLAIHAGADFPRWILMEHLGRQPRINPNGFRGDVAMLRYDESVFVPRASRLR